MVKRVVYWVEACDREKDRTEWILRFALDRQTNGVGHIEIGIWPYSKCGTYYMVEFYKGELMLFVDTLRLPHKTIKRKASMAPWFTDFNSLDNYIIERGVKETIREIFKTLAAI